MATQRPKATPTKKPVVTPPASKTAAGAGQRSNQTAAAPAPPAAGQAQLFERAVAAFHRRNYSDAIALFQRAASGENREMAHSARQHADVCQRRLLAAAAAPRTAEELYNYAIALINDRKLTDAEKYLRQALIESPNGDHLHYALALCRGLSGDLEQAYNHLKRAIDIDARNRVTARNDPDFSEIAQTSPLAELLYSGITSGS